MRRFLSILLILLLAISSAWGQDDNFNPNNPPEPEQPAMRLDLKVSPSEAGSAYGYGRYVPGKKVSLSAYGNEGFHFINWTNAKDEIVSTIKDFYYTKQDGHETLTANFAFDPDSPADPAEPSTIMYYRLTLTASEGGNVYGGGSYLAGKQVTLYAYSDSHFDFDGWYSADGEKLSSQAIYTYTTTPQHVMITGRFTFNPNNPNEPAEPTLKPMYTITASATDGGSVNWSNKRVQVGESVTLAAYPNYNYRFEGWYLNGTLYTKLQQFSYTVTSKITQNFEARFSFDPELPSEPQASTTTKHSFFLMNKVTTPGTTIPFTIYLSNVRTLRDMTFQLSFPRLLIPDNDNISISERIHGYNLSLTKTDETTDELTYLITLTGGEITAGNTALLTFYIDVPNDIATAQDYPVKINQVSVVEVGDDGISETSVSASTRNGRISVYKLGDANSDDDINVADLSGVALFMLDKPEDHLIHVSADMDANGIIEEVDFDILVDSVLKQSIQQSTVAVREHRTPPQRDLLKESQTDNVLNLPSKTTVEIGHNGISIPISMTNTKVITGFQFDLYMQKGLDMSTDENGDFVIELFRSSRKLHGIYMCPLSDGGLRVLCCSKLNSAFSGNSGDILMLTFDLVNNLLEGDYNISMRNIYINDESARAYKADDVSTTITVMKNDVVVSAKSYTREYGDVNPTFEFTSEGATLEGNPEIICEATATSPVGEYPIIIKKGSVTNYNDTYVNGVLTITKAPLSISAKNYSMKQGDAMPTFDIEYSGFKNNETKDVLKKQPTISCEANSATPPGSYEIIVRDAEADNYEISYTKGTLTINEADPVMVTANSYTITYGDAIPAFEYTSSGAALSGTPAISCEATSASPVGTYPIIIKKGSVTNYNDTYVNGVLTITKAPLTISVGNYTKKQYDPMPEFAISFEGFKNNETEVVLTKQPTLSYDANEDSAPGEYPIVANGAEASNYQIQYVAGMLTVVEPDSYTLTYMIDGEEYQSFNIKYREKIVPLEVPDKEGYTFSGWNEIPETMPAHDVIVTGSFTIKLATSIKIDKESIIFSTLSSLKLNISLTPADLINKTTIWSSSNPNIATVDKEGVVIPVSNGETYIIVNTTDGSKLKDSCKVTVDIQNIFETIATQTTLTVRPKSGVNEVKNFKLEVDGKLFDISGTEAKVTSLAPNKTYHIIATAIIDGFNWAETFDETTKDISVDFENEVTPTTVNITACYDAGDATVTHAGFDEGMESHSLSLKGLEPNQQYEFIYYITTAEGGTDTYKVQVTTEDAHLRLSQTKVVTIGDVVTISSTNIAEENVNVGLEWRCIDWSDEIQSNYGIAYIYEGSIEGVAKNLKSDKSWKIRSFFQSKMGNRFCSDWVTVNPSIASYYEPSVHTLNTISVEDNTAKLIGFFIQGTDNVKKQGFMYWKIHSPLNEIKGLYAPAVPANATIVEVKGDMMETILENLEFDTEYCYVAFVTTINEETFYGEEHTFKTRIGTQDEVDRFDGVLDNSNTTEVTLYNINGHKINALQKGLNIIRMRDGTTKKVIIK